MQEMGKSTNDFYLYLYLHQQDFTFPLLNLGYIQTNYLHCSVGANFI